jgi:uncharacterized protein YacL
MKDYGKNELKSLMIGGILGIILALLIDFYILANLNLSNLTQSIYLTLLKICLALIFILVFVGMIIGTILYKVYILLESTHLKI